MKPLALEVLFIFKSENFLAPVGLCIISAVARQKGCQTYLCEMNSDDPFDSISRIRPDIIAYSSSTGEAKHYLGLNRLIKKEHPHIFTIMGGPHPTFYPQMIKDSSLDAVCIGEGETAFSRLLDAFLLGRPIDGVPNIYTDPNQSVIVDNLIEDLDSLPFPDYSLLYDNTPMGRLPLKNFIASRGCPYSCTYCFNHKWNAIYKGKGNIVRRHSVDYVLDNIIKVRKRWPLSCVKFFPGNTDKA
jgi:anaerobic magnesium-protoporphyrin IX monomethyl ester cyclase